MEHELPVIDVSGWSRDDAARRSIAEQVDDACRTFGFFHVVGHGVPRATIDAMLDACDGLFDRPAAEKAAYTAPPEVNRGYSPVGAESLAYSLGVDSPPDLFEAFNVARDDVDESDPAVAAERHRIFAPNVWPERPASFRPAVTAYFDAVADLALRLTRIFCVALGMPEDHIADRCRHPTETLRMIRYRREPEMPDPVEGQLRMGAHTDYGIVTVLHGDPVPGLEVLGPDGEWWPVIPSRDAYVINLGDLLAQWTNDRWRSTLHRVVPPPATTSGPALRRSAAFFMDGDHDALIEVLPTCCSEDDPARYPPVRAGDHLMQKILGSRGGQRPVTTDTVGERISSVAGP